MDMRLQLQKLAKAYEQEEGIKPMGSAQAELLSTLASVIAHAERLEAKLKEIEAANHPTNTAKRIEQKLDLLLARKDRSVFEAVFGKAGV